MLQWIKKLNGELPFAYEKKSGGGGPSAEEIAAAKQKEKESWDLDDAERRFNKGVKDYGSKYKKFQDDRRVANELRSRGGMSDLISGKDSSKEAYSDDFSNKIKMPTFEESNSMRLRDPRGNFSDVRVDGATGPTTTGTSYKDKMAAWEKAIGDVEGQSAQWEDNYMESDKDPSIQGKREFKKPGRGQKKKKGLMDTGTDEIQGGLM